MTTAEQLMSDREFLSRRVQEQDDYMYQLHVRLHENQIDYNRYVELGESAMHQRLVFVMALDGIKYSGIINGLRHWNKPGFGLNFIAKNEESRFGQVTKPGYHI